MNLRTHTWSIPAVSGLAAFALLVAADFAFRRATQGPGYGFAAYVTDVNSRPDRALVRTAALALPDAPEAAPKPPAPVLLAAGRVPDLLQPAPLAAPVAPVKLAAAAAPPPADVGTAVALPPAPAAEVLADATVAAPEAPAVELAADEAPVKGITCTTDRGFKRCRIGQ